MFELWRITSVGHDRMDELIDAMKIFFGGKLERKIYLVDLVIGGGMTLTLRLLMSYIYIYIYIYIWSS